MGRCCGSHSWHVVAVEPGQHFFRRRLSAGSVPPRVRLSSGPGAGFGSGRVAPQRPRSALKARFSVSSLSRNDERSVGVGSFSVTFGDARLVSFYG